jgi:hypothetical protein
MSASGPKQFLCQFLCVDTGVLYIQYAETETLTRTDSDGTT